MHFKARKMGNIKLMCIALTLGLCVRCIYQLHKSVLQSAVLNNAQNKTMQMVAFLMYPSKNHCNLRLFALGPIANG